MTYPLLRRDIQPVFITIDGRQMIMFIDPLKLAKDGYAIDSSMIPLLKMLDGNNDPKDIQMGLMRFTGGTLVPLSAVESFIAQLDAFFLLESESFTRKLTDLVDEFTKKNEREPFHAGASYNSDPAELQRFFHDAEAGLPPLQEGNGAEIVGILAPHIDIQAAGHAYVDVYRRLKDRSYDLVIIFGINHNGRHGSDGLFCITDKDFLTPESTMKTDKEFVSSLKQVVPQGTVSGCDFDHMTEHSIEFQTVFLAHYLGNGTRIVPILCNGIHGFLRSGSDPFQDERFTAFRDAIADIVSRQGRKVLFVSGVDFSHIGHKFGHDVPVQNLLPEAQANDGIIISHLKGCSPEGIYRNARETSDRYNVCGLSSMIIFSSLLGPCSAELLHHSTYEEPATNSAVTYASMVFTREG
jgi:hypothetical protein